MPITYNSDTDTITVDNGTFTPEDIYQADKNNSWGVIQKAGTGYYLNANLQVGQSHETYFNVENCFFQVGNETAYKFIKLPNYYGKGFTVKNSHFKWYVDSASNWWYGRWTVEDSKVEKYCSGIFPRMAAGFTVKNSIVLGRSIDVEYGTVEFKNARFDLTGTRFQLGHLSGLDIDNVVFYNGSDIMFMVAGSTLTNSKIQDVYRAFYLAGDGVWAQVIDCEFEEKYQFAYDSNYLLIKYSFACVVFDEDGNPLKNAEVKLYDVNNNLVYNESTDENGQTPYLPILYKKVEGKSYTETLYSPHKLVVVKDGYPTFEGKFNIDRKLNKIVILGHTLSYTIDDIYNELKNHRNSVEPKIDTTISSRASQESVNAIPTNPLLDNDSRLDNLDATISSRLASNDSRLDNLDAAISSRSSHTPADVWSYSNRELTNPDNYKADVSDLAKETTVQSIKSQTDKFKFNTDGDIIATLDGETVNLTTETEAQIDNIENNVINVDQYKADISNLALESTVQAVKSQTDKLQFDTNNNVKSNAQNLELSYLDAAISSRASQSSVDAIPTNPLLDNDSRLDNLDAKISSRSSHSPADVWNYSSRTLTNSVSIDDSDKDDIVDRVWDEPIADHVTDGTFGAKNQNKVPSEDVDDYKTDVSNLALESTVQTVKTQTDKFKFNTDGDVVATLDGETVVLSSETEAQIDNIESNVTNYDQYKADTSNLAKEVTVQAIKSQTDKLQFTDSNDVKATLDGEAVTLNSDTESQIDEIESAVNQIKTKTDNLPNDPASNTNINNAKDSVITEIQLNRNLINELLDIEEGNWEIKNNQMIFYKRDGSELIRFNLYDKDGKLTETKVYKRVRL